MNNISYNDLPKSMQNLMLETGISLEAVLKLMSRWGGSTSLYIPKTIEDDNELARELGQENALRIVEIYGGDRLRNIPVAKKTHAAVRNREIIRLRAKGLSLNAIALQVRVTERHVCNVLKKARANARQSSEPKQANA